jgi:hypothetical protein
MSQVDDRIPLSGVAPQFMAPGQQLQLMEYARQARQRQAIQQIHSTPGMYERGLPTDAALKALGDIAPDVANAETARRAQQLATESLERQRAEQADARLREEFRDEADEVMGTALGRYYKTGGTEEDRRRAMTSYINEQADQWEKSGKFKRYKITPEQIVAFRSHGNPNDIAVALSAHSKKDLVERFDTKEAAEVAADGQQAPPSGMGVEEKKEGTPLSEVGKQPDATVDTKSGAVVRPMTKEPAIGEKEIKEGEADPVAEQQITAKAPDETPDSLRRQAQSEEGKAGRLRKLGTKSANKLADEADKKAKELRSGSVALEQRIQKETDQELASDRLKLAVQKAGATQEPLDERTAALLGEAVAKGNYALAAGLARNQVAQKQVKEAMGKYARDHGMSATDLNIAHANFSGAMQENRTLGGRAAQMAIPVNEMKQFIPMAEEAINQVPRGQWLPLNKLIQLFQTQHASPEQRNLVLAVQGVRNAYAQVVSRGGISVHSQELAEDALNTADSPQAFKAALRRMWAEAEGGRKAIHQSQKEAGGSIRGDEFNVEPYPGEKGPNIKGKVGGSKSRPMELLKPYSDPEEEKAYQEYKRKQSGG